MRWRKRVSHLLMLIILCILIIYAGIYLQIDISKNEMVLRIHQTVIENAGKMYLSGMFYEDKDWSLAKQAMNLIPLGNYMDSIETVELSMEDEQTYEMILEMQANDENEVDENGKLINTKKSEENNAQESQKTSGVIDKSIEKLGDFEYLVSHFYTVDGSTSVNEKILDVKKLLKKDMTLKRNENGPKILIYHTHSQEAFRDSEKGKTSDTIMGMGAHLAELLNEKYGIETLHHEGVYDLIDGKLDRSKAYQLAEPDIRKILDENPSIEVVIDLHRDGVKESTHLMTEIDGKKTAQIMFFNGMSRTKANGDIEYLHNPYIEDNLAFSLQMQLYATEKYPGLTRRIYLKSYRYNMHLMPKTLLIEAGAQTNTVAEMKNSMKVLAEILYGVLTGEK